MITSISNRTNTLLLLVAPTIHEFKIIQRAVKDQLSSGYLALALSGMGLQAVSTFCQTLEARNRPFSGIVLLGWAGGLSPDLKAGDVIIASSAMNTKGELISCDILPLPGAIGGPVLTVPEPALTLKEKKKHQTSGAIAVEMEAYPLAAWAQTRGIPFTHTRVVLDAVNESLPDFGDSLDIFGRAYPFRFSSRLLTRPQHIGQLFRLYLKTRTLAPVLGRLAGKVTQSWFEQYPLYRK